MQHSSSDRSLEFFVELDREVTRRIVVRDLGAGRYRLDIVTQNDRGFENSPETIDINGKAALAARLIDEGVLPETAYDELEMEAPARSPVLSSLLLSALIWLAAAAAAITLGRSVWNFMTG
ncbi:MAG: hypothetical protein PW791_07180 [Neorhizobium sp.]|nr:hypothetical protein [Neorhizobium sp.]